VEGEGEQEHEGAEGAVLEYPVRNVAVVGMSVIIVVDLTDKRQEG
jgi:hypothetical protein